MAANIGVLPVATIPVSSASSTHLHSMLNLFRLTTNKSSVSYAPLIFCILSTNIPVQINDFLSSYVPQARNRNRNARRQQQAADDDDEAESEEDLADDLDDMNVDGDGARDGRSKAKYMRLLRKVANRQTTEVVIDLSDLKKVCLELEEEVIKYQG